MKIMKPKLEAVATEFNKLLALTPALKTGRKITKSQLGSDIREAAGELVSDDRLSTETSLVLAQLGVIIQQSEPAKEQPKPSARYTRMAAVSDALKSAKKPLSKAEWTEKADKLYTDHGGKSNLNETKWSLNYVIGVLASLDIAIETERGFQLK